MTQRSETSHAPKSPGEELGLDRAVPVAFVKIRPEIVTLEIGENVLNHEGLPIGHHQRRISTTVIHRVDQCGCGGKHAIVNSVYGVIDGVYVGYAAIVVDRQILNVACRAPKLVEDLQAVVCARVLLVDPRFEIVEEIEFEVIHESNVDLIAV